VDQSAEAGTRAWLIGGLVAGGLGAASLFWTGTARAFPFLDPTNADTTPGAAPVGAEMQGPDVAGLRNQLRLVNPGAAGNPSAWTIVPRLTLQEMLTDNVYEVSSPRKFDAVTVVAPGIAILADTARLRLNLDYQPNVLIHAINGNLNVVTQQLNATGIVTVVPEFAYIDVRALSGVQSRFGALAGAGTLGQPGAALAPAQGANVAAYGANLGLNRQNAVQTTSLGISPYILGQLGDYGSYKLGVSADVSRSSNIHGIAATPFPTGGTGSTQLFSTEEIAHYTSGEFLTKFQYALDIDASQSRTQGYSTNVIIGTTPATIPGQSFSSERETINNQLAYAVSHNLSLLASAGLQEIHYSGGAAPPISGPIWNVGFTYSPGPESSITVTYGHQYGQNSIQASGYFAVGGRSAVTLSYTNSVGTQLENLQNQVNNGVVGTGGVFIDARTGGPALIAQNSLGVQNGVFRFKTFNASWTTTAPRDTFQATLTVSDQTTLTAGPAFIVVGVDAATGTQFVIPSPTASGQSTDVATASLYWSHELAPDLQFSATAAYSFIRRSGGLNDSSISTAIGVQYLLSPTTTLTGRYAFFDRISKLPGYSLYQNILLVGITRQF
jgi:Putative beta-barrel porin 2